MLPAEFEPTIPASAGPQTCALDRAAAGIGYSVIVIFINVKTFHLSFKRLCHS
jgi:hypothetical protein